MIYTDTARCVLLCESMDNMIARALQTYCDKAVLLDETSEVKKALIWKVLYDAAEENRVAVSAMTKQQMNKALMR